MGEIERQTFWAVVKDGRYFHDYADDDSGQFYPLPSQATYWDAGRRAGAEAISADLNAEVVEIEMVVRRHVVTTKPLKDSR